MAAAGVRRSTLLGTLISGGAEGADIVRLIREPDLEFLAIALELERTKVVAFHRGDAVMTSFTTVRDPVKDHLLTPQNSALIIIDHQPGQVGSVASRSKRELVANLTALARIGKLYCLPVVLATVNVATGIS
jgi:hypothetical protein